MRSGYASSVGCEYVLIGNYVGLLLWVRVPGVGVVMSVFFVCFTVENVGLDSAAFVFFFVVERVSTLFRPMFAVLVVVLEDPSEKSNRVFSCVLGMMGYRRKPCEYSSSADFATARVKRNVPPIL